MSGTREFKQTMVLDNSAGSTSPTEVSPKSPTVLNTHTNTTSPSTSPSNKGLTHWLSTPSSKLNTNPNNFLIPPASPLHNPVKSPTIAIQVEKKEEFVFDPNTSLLSNPIKIKTYEVVKIAERLLAPQTPTSPNFPKRHFSDEREKKISVKASPALRLFKPTKLKDHTLNGKLQRIIESCNFNPKK